VADPATVFYSMWIVMRPVHEATQVIPPVHPPKLNAITHTERHSLRELYIVGDQQRLPVGQLQNEALVSRPVVIVRQQPRYKP
jgi:hypothetical protein